MTFDVLRKASRQMVYDLYAGVTSEGRRKGDPKFDIRSETCYSRVRRPKSASVHKQSPVLAAVFVFQPRVAYEPSPISLHFL